MSQPYNKAGWIVLLSCVAFSVLWVVYFLVIYTPVDLGEEAQLPPPILTQVLDISSVGKYWEESDLMVQKGAEVYSIYCALCHGPQGKGDGLAGRGLKPPPRDFTQGQWKHGGSRIDLFKIITNGSEGTSMASFSHIPKKERWALVHFIRSLTQNKVQDQSSQVQEFAKSFER